MAKIGIRLADGKFYPILQDEAAARKRLVVTTVKDDQPSVQIDVYRSTREKDDYVGSLVIENIPPRPSGEPDIRLDLSLDEDGKLSAFAEEEASGEHQALTVSLKSLSEEEKYEIPDFDFQEDEGFDLSTDELPEPAEPSASLGEEPGFGDGLSFDDADSFDEPEALAEDEPLVTVAAAGTDRGGADFAVPEEEPEGKPTRRRASPLLVGIIAALATALVLVAAFFIYRWTADRPAEPPTVVSRPAEPAATPKAPEPAKVAEAPKAPEPAKVAEDPKAPEPAKVAEAPKAPAPAKAPAKTGVWHRVRWGDTLWDISITYYRTPWLYKTIAKANKIRNPDLIVSGTKIYIPPR